MATVNINVYGRDYAIACDDGEESHLNQLTQMVNHRVQQLLGQIGRAPEHTMLIYASLMLADELLDVTRAYRRLEAKYKEAQSGQPEEDNNKIVEMEQAMAQTMQDVASRIEALAGQLEQKAA